MTKATQNKQGDCGNETGKMRPDDFLKKHGRLILRD